MVEAVLLNIINGFPGRGLKVIGVTGTNGKTTTSFMIHRMLQNSGYKTALMSTVAWGVGDEIKPQIQHYTNVPTPELMKRLKVIRAAKVDYVVMEVTSHALAQNRVWGIPYSVAVLTNLTHEHLAYHGTFERYRDAKRKLFKRANKNKRGMRAGVINADDPSAEFFASDINNPITYGLKSGDIKAKNVQLKPAGIEYDIEVSDAKYHISSHLAGSFNVENSLAAVGVGRVLGLSVEQIEKGIGALQYVEGRMTKVVAGQDFDVIVDYAHTPDSYEKLFKDLRPVVKGKMIVLGGSLGGGDKAKRPAQGRLSGKYADEVIICEEDDRLEDPQQIMDDIAAGAKESGKQLDKDLFMIHDRVEAINFAVKRAKKGDTLLLLGKGHEKTIERADGEHPWDEIAVAKKALQQRT